jgi:DNA polymerase-1
VLNAPILAIDTETNSLNPHHATSQLFAFTLADATTEEYYTRDGLDELREIARTPRTWVLANAKFDMHFLAKEGIFLLGTIWDVLTMARIEYNDHQSYSLDACGERIGWPKDPAVEQYITANKCYTMVDGDKHKHYDRVPRSLMEPYAKRDARVTYELRRHQVKVFKSWDESPVPVKSLVRLECDTTPVLFEMERRGIRVDQKYVRDALTDGRRRIAALEKELQNICGKPFTDSAKFLKSEFLSRGIPHGKTEKGNPSFAEEHLVANRAAHPLVDMILKRRELVKSIETYFANTLKYTNTDGRLHPNIKQAAAVTGRMSITEPAAQTWPTDEEHDHGDYPVRRSFIADPGCLILSMDWAQVELRMISDEAQDLEMIDAIQSGKDFHQETADMAGVKRSLAKNGRFAKLYGAGMARVATTLGVSEAIAQKICDAIDKSAPRTKAYVNSLMKSAKTSPYGFNWIGRRFWYPDKNFVYKYPNARIQGGCADLMRVALVGIAKILAGKKTYMLLPIHDEIVFNLDPGEHYLIPLLKQAMISAYRSKWRLDLDVSIAVGPNFHDLEEWRDGKAEGNSVQRASAGVSELSSELLAL